jgi:hypothetical protein
MIIRNSNGSNTNRIYRKYVASVDTGSTTASSLIFAGAPT